MYDKLFPIGLSRNYLSDNFDPASSKSNFITAANYVQNEHIKYRIPLLISQDIKIYIEIWNTHTNNPNNDNKITTHVLRSGTRTPKAIKDAGCSLG